MVLFIFISSVIKGLEFLREKIKNELETDYGQNITLFLSNFEGSRPSSPKDYIIENISKCDILILILGKNYGFIPAGWDVSVTEFEYQTAKDKNKPILFFRYDDGIPEEKQQIFINQVEDFEGGLFRGPIVSKDIELTNWLKEGIHYLLIDSFKRNSEPITPQYRPVYSKPRFIHPLKIDFIRIELIDVDFDKSYNLIRQETNKRLKDINYHPNINVNILKTKLTIENQSPSKLTDIEIQIISENYEINKIEYSIDNLILQKPDENLFSMNVFYGKKIISLEISLKIPVFKKFLHYKSPNLFVSIWSEGNNIYFNRLLNLQNLLELSFNLEPKNKEKISYELFGFDLKMIDGDISFKNGDLEIVKGRENLLQSIKMLLLTKKGEIKSHPEIGSNLYMIDFADSKINIEKKAKIYIEETLIKETRIFSILEIEINYLGDKKLNVIIEFIPIDYPEPCKFEEELDFNWEVE